MTGTVAPPAAPTRLAFLDRARGLAVLCMVVDHLALFASGHDWLRWTVGRLAMPLFFLIGGALVRRFSWRHGWVFLVGLGLPVLAPWVDQPNVLVWYALGALTLVVARWAGLGRSVFVVLVLALLANNVYDGTAWGTSYNAAGLVGLMFVGSLIGPGAFAWAGRLPAWFGWLGRYPLSMYVGHVLALTTLGVLTEWGP